MTPCVQIHAMHGRRDRFESTNLGQNPVYQNHWQTESPQTDVDLQKMELHSMQHNFGASAYFEANRLTK